MTNDQIIEMAKQSWFAIISQPTSPTTIESYPAPHDEQSIIAFARLIQQAQREEDAVICIDLMARVGFSDFHFDAGDQCAATIRKGGAA
jgi:hypothetical protein